MKKFIHKIGLITIVLTIAISLPRVTFAVSNKPTALPTKSQAAPTKSTMPKGVTPMQAVKAAKAPTPTTNLKAIPTHTPSATITKAAPTMSSKKPSATPTHFPIIRTPGQLAAATVASISGSTLTITKEKKTYTVRVSAKTLFRKRYWGVSDLKSIAVNDRVNVAGDFLDSKKTIMEALLIRDLSIMKRRGVVFGTVIKTSPGILYIEPKGYLPQRVALTKSTALVDKVDAPVLFSQIKQGDRIRVMGLWDRETNTITETTQIKDFVLPEPRRISPRK